MGRTRKSLSPMYVAAAAGLATPWAASGAFTVTLSAPTASNGYNVYNVYALNTGGTTGTKLDEIASTITTVGSTNGNALVIQLADEDGDGVADANVTGNGVTSTGLFTYERIGNTASVFSAAYVTPSPYTTDPTSSGSQTATLNAAYTAGNVHSLEVDGISTTNGAAANTGSGAIFAHIVVPVNTRFTVSGNVGGDQGMTQTFSVNDTATTSIVNLTAGSTLPAAGYGAQLTTANATFSPNTPVSNSINLNGTLNPGKAHATTAGGMTSGNVMASGFSAGATEVYAMKLLVSGVSPTSAQVSTIVSDINASASIDGITASAVSTSNYSAVFSTFDVLLTSTLTGQSQDVLGWNFDNETNIAGITVTDVAVAPEPTSLTLLGIGVAGLVGRRRRRR